MPPGAIRPFIDRSALLDISKSDFDLPESSFFQSPDGSKRDLPTPSSIISQYGHGGKRTVVLKDLSMVVKIGFLPELRLGEVQTMHAMRQVFSLSQGEIQVPEVFGWRRHSTRDGDQLFVYMSLIEGQTLRAAWPSLTEDDKLAIQDDLRGVVTKLRGLTQSNPQSISSVNGGDVLDRYFNPDYEKGPFPDCKTFHDWIFAAATRQNPAEDGIIKCLDHPDMCRDLLPDDAKVYFTHGDLTLCNIIVSGPPGSCRIAAIIDWEQAGWYPEYWEFCKMHFAVGPDDEWERDDWPSKIVEPDEEAYWAFSTYYEWRSGGT